MAHEHGPNCAHGHQDHGAEPAHAHAHHGPSLSLYLGIYFALLFLLLITVGAAFLDLGPLNVPIMLAIAIAKTLLVVLFFMHVGYGSLLVGLAAASGFLWLLIMFAYTMMDYLTRTW